METTLEDFEKFLVEINFESTFWSVHRDRYLESAFAVFRALESCQVRGRAIEVGASYVFAEWFKRIGFENVEVSDFRPAEISKKVTLESPFSGVTGSSFVAYNIDLEAEKFACDNDAFDLAVCFEVIEHMDVDPSFLMGELNRIVRPSGVLVMSTPNSTSSQILRAVLNGQAPQLYMCYQRDRSPYRHNFEYSPPQIRSLVEAAGFEIEYLWTKDTFNPPATEALDLLARNGYSIDLRGDNMFLVARKRSEVRDRYPGLIYEHRW